MAKRHGGEADGLCATRRKRRDGARPGSVRGEGTRPLWRRAALPLLLAALLHFSAAPAAMAQQDPGSQDAPNTDAPNTDAPAMVQPDDSQPDTAQIPVFANFWQRFRAAAKANDLAALKAMMHLPFQYGGETYGAAQFAELARRLFDAKARQCLQREAPLHDQDVYEVFCGEAIYVFGADPILDPVLANAPDGSGWRLLELGVND